MAFVEEHPARALQKVRCGGRIVLGVRARDEHRREATPVFGHAAKALELRRHVGALREDVDRAPERLARQVELSRPLARVGRADRDARELRPVRPLLDDLEELAVGARGGVPAVLRGGERGAFAERVGVVRVAREDAIELAARLLRAVQTEQRIDEAHRVGVGPRRIIGAGDAPEELEERVHLPRVDRACRLEVGHGAVGVAGALANARAKNEQIRGRRVCGDRRPDDVERLPLVARLAVRLHEAQEQTSIRRRGDLQGSERSRRVACLVPELEEAPSDLAPRARAIDGEPTLEAVGEPRAPEALESLRERPQQAPRRRGCRSSTDS